jgi:hypothetical protein
MSQHSRKYLLILCVSAMVVTGLFLAAGCNSVLVPNSTVPSGWTAYTDPHSGLTFNYPNNWTPDSAGSNTYFTINSTDVLDITQPGTSGTLTQIAQADITDNNCPALDDNGQPVDHIVNTSTAGVLFVLSCTATTDDYNYVTHNSTGDVIELTFHDAFPTNTPAGQTPSTFQTLIASAH